jgi:hypothetical protein
MDLQQQIAAVRQKEHELLTQAEHARLVRQLRGNRTSALAHGYAEARRAIRHRSRELSEPIPIRPNVESGPAVTGEEGPMAA